MTYDYHCKKCQAPVTVSDPSELVACVCGNGSWALVDEVA